MAVPPEVDLSSTSSRISRALALLRKGISYLKELAEKLELVDEARHSQLNL